MKEFKYLAMILCFSALVACSSSSDEDDNNVEYDPCEQIGAKIINGDVCSEGKNTIVKLNLYDANGGDIGICTGTAITQRAIITAAHCFLGGVQGVIVDTGEKSIQAIDVAIHPDFGPDSTESSLLHDVAILYVNEDLNVSVYPILVSEEADKNADAIVTGYGIDEDGDYGKLQAGNATIEGVSEDHIWFEYDGNGANTCQGDSGGPLLVVKGTGWVIAGITSSGNVAGCREGDLSLYTNMANVSNANFVFSRVPAAVAK
ncbi:MAG: trypsin-like serine protease [Deltaproteobacteria bacterium]|nr:trypsin-like serine protease [Deltaproteobacteria bacterium]